jgi:hypothetical protein
MAIPLRESRTLGIAAKRLQVTPAVAPVHASAFNCYRDVRAGLARAFRRPEGTISATGDR